MRRTTCPTDGQEIASLQLAAKKSSETFRDTVNASRLVVNLLYAKKGIRKKGIYGRSEWSMVFDSPAIRGWWRYLAPFQQCVHTFYSAINSCAAPDYVDCLTFSQRCPDLPSIYVCMCISLRLIDRLIPAI